ncbi:hypothetical protein P4909_08340 [Escherichia coli]
MTDSSGQSIGTVGQGSRAFVRGIADEGGAGGFPGMKKIARNSAAFTTRYRPLPP